LTDSLQQLIVLWRNAGELPLGATVLSFLPPSAEESLRQRHCGTVISARDVSRSVRAATQTLYIDLVAAVGTALCEGRTLRERVGTLHGVSRWWFHPVSFRDCESDPAYDRLVAAETIRATQGESGKLQLHGAPADLAAALSSRYEVQLVAPQPKSSRVRTILRALASRVGMMFRELRHLRAARPFGIAGRFDVALSAFWDWSIARDRRSGRLEDRYFKQLAARLKRDGVSVKSLAWLDPDSEPGMKGRTLKAVLRPLRGRDDVILLQGELGTLDVVRAYTDFSPWRAYRAIRNSRAFRDAFNRAGFDYFPLLDLQLSRGFLGASLPNCELVFRATQRSLSRHHCDAFVSFLEHFPHARAQYAAASSTQVMAWAVQHASYCHEKTFLILDADRELGGAPDSLECPHPDAVCAAGELGRQLFLESGYRPADVRVTGSPRYDHIAVSQAKRAPQRLRTKILLAASLTVDPELDMIEAVVAATAERDDIDLVLRNHPFRRIDREARFVPFRSRVIVSAASLQQDLDAADLIIFSYSTVAEEAFLAGKAVWQWLPAGFHGSALAEVWAVPQFSTVESLRRALDNALREGFESPAPDAQRQVARALFGPCDGKAADRVAAEIGFVLKRNIRRTP
jgi:hypothetical protein